jgi:hypothetical protein
MRFSSVCRSRGVHVTDPGIAVDGHSIVVLRGQRLNGLDDPVDQRREGEGLQIKLHSPGLDLREVEDVVGYDKLTVSFAAFVLLVSIRIWIRFVHAT